MDDVEAIRQLKARYFRCLDTKDWPGYRSVFTDDVMIDVTGSGGAIYRGIEPYMDYVTTHLATLRTAHHGHMPEIHLVAPREATGIWSMEDWVRMADGREMHGLGHYHERYVKQDDGWKIREMRLTRLRLWIDGSEIEI